MSGNLLPSATYASPGDALWASRVAPTVVSPLLIKSADGTKTGTIAQNNNGNMVMYSDPAGDLFLGSGSIIVPSANASANTLIATANDGTSEFIAESSVRLGTNSTSGGANFSVQKGTGSIGQIYDTVYNPTVSYIVLNDNTTGDVTYDQTASRPAGKYQLQLSIENVVATGTSTNFLQMGTTAPPSTQLINFSGNESTPGGVGTALNLNSGYFTHAGGNLRIFVTAVTTPWTGTWSLQLVKIG